MSGMLIAEDVAWCSPMYSPSDVVLIQSESSSREVDILPALKGEVLALQLPKQRVALVDDFSN